MIIGQIISLFDNAILRLSLSLCVLQVTGSAFILATTLAASMLLTVLLSPFGGILVGHVSRRSIMFSLGLLTSFLISGFSMVSTRGFNIVLIVILMISLSIIQAFYQFLVQTSIPLFISESQLVQTNGIVTQINVLATLLGPILGGSLFSFLLLSLLLNISGIASFLSTIPECIMRIPFQRVVTDGSMLSIIHNDCRQNLHFLRHDNPTLLYLLLLLAGLNPVLSSFITVGLPVIPNITLQLPPAFYGWLETTTGIGSIADSIALPFFLKRVNMSGAWHFPLNDNLFLFPIALALFLHTPVYIAHVYILASNICIMLSTALFNIYVQTFPQKSTSNQLLGKVVSAVTMVVMCSYPIDRSSCDILLETFATRVGLLILFTCITSLIISLLSRNALKTIGNDYEEGAVLIQ